ncbi:MAG: pyrimidine-nucleoside phosphorylase [Sporolactobacillus sp.]
MRMVDLIARKRDGDILTEKEIRFVINGYVSGKIPDYQMSAWTMAIYFSGMTDEEITALTRAMIDSGDRVDLSSIPGVKVDKHSTGGVGDTTTLVLAPLVAALGIPVAKMSGRGLGFTGGTLDKLESIPGFRVEWSTGAFIEHVRTCGLAVIGQTEDLVPADKKLYALRDVTGTVESIPLISSSIMSKKIASGADAIVLEVTTGSGAFMKDEQSAVALAETMVRIGTRVGRRTMAVITDMDQPLGRAVGNALEVKEAIALLHGEGPDDLKELVLTLGSLMVYAAGEASDPSQARVRLLEVLQSGRAWDQFRRFIASQGGDLAYVDNPERLPQAARQLELLATSSGYLTKLPAASIGLAAMQLGAGRETKESMIDHAAGIMLHRKIGDYVQAGEPILTLHTNRDNGESVREALGRAVTLGDYMPAHQLIHRIITD